MRTFKEDLEYLKSRPIFLLAGIDDEDDCHILMTVIFRCFLEKAGTDDFPAIIELYEKGLISILASDDGFSINVCDPSEAPQLRRNQLY